MDLMQNLRQYKDQIIMGAILLGTVSLIDQSGLFEIGLSGFGEWISYAMIAISVLGAYSFYEFYMGKKPKKVYVRPPEPKDEKREVVAKLKSVNPPEMYGCE